MGSTTTQSPEKRVWHSSKLSDFYLTPSVMWLADLYKKSQFRTKMALKRAQNGFDIHSGADLSSSKIIPDLKERDRFKSQQLGLRSCDQYIQLSSNDPDGSLKRRYAERRSIQRFSKRPISFQSFSQFIKCLGQITLDGSPKYLYPSSGGLYPIQTYLHIKAGRIEEVDAGLYYYRPIYYGLAPLSDGAGIDRIIHQPFINQPIYDEAAFSIFFIAQLSAIAPMYGELSMHFAILEAGYMVQLLMMTAPASGIGLCSIEILDFNKMESQVSLDEHQVLINSILGGQIDFSIKQPVS